MFRDFLFRNLASSGTMLKAIEKEIVEESPIKDYAKYKHMKGGSQPGGRARCSSW
jgi:hypothetical protein